MKVMDTKLQSSIKVTASKTLHYGNPPHVGWWATYPHKFRDDKRWRWWDGKVFSFAIDDWKAKLVKPSEVAMMAGAAGSYNAKELCWTYEWPRDACIARVCPDTGTITGSGPWPYELP